MGPRIAMLVKDTPVVRRLRAIPEVARIISIIRGWSGAFHGDRIYQETMLTLIDFLKVSAFVETGTHYGVSTGFIASRRPTLPVYSCEIDRQVYAVAKASLGRFANVVLLNRSSEDCLPHWISSGALGDLPMFYLDAHFDGPFYDSSLLQREVEFATSSLKHAIIVIDDFQVPGRDEFSWIRSGDKSACNLERIKPVMDRRHTYSILYPKYSHKEAFGRQAGTLTGYAIICQNLEPEVSAIAGESLVRQQFSRAMGL